MKFHPVFLILFGLLICSIGINIMLLNSNQKLVYKIQKLEAGPAKGLFIQPDEQVKPPLSDKEINDLIKEMLKKMLRERIV